MSRKIIIGIVLGVLIVGGMLFFTLQEKEETIKIGVIAPLSGDFAEGGQGVLNGIILATEEINARGGINGHILEVVYEDGQYDERIESQAFTTFEETKKPLLYISIFDPFLGHLSILAEEKQVMLIIPIVSYPFADDPNRSWTYSYAADNERSSRTLLDLFDYLDAKRVGVLHVGDPFGFDEVEILEELLAEEGKTMQLVLATPGMDYTSEIKELHDTDAIYFLGFPAEAPLVRAQMNEVGYEGHLLALEPIIQAVPYELPVGDEVYLPAPAVYKKDFLFAAEASKRYESRFSAPIGLAGAVGYDTVYIVADLLEGEPVTREHLKELFEQGFSYSGVLGEVNLHPGENEFPYKMFPARIIDGELEYLR